MKNTRKYKIRMLEEFRELHRLCGLKSWENPSEKRLRHLEKLRNSENRKSAVRKSQQREKYKELQRKITRKNWQDPVIRAKRMKEMQKVAPKQKERVKLLWQKPDYVKKQIKARGQFPNKTEIKLLNILNKLYPKKWKYVGDGEFILGGKNPDFININGKKVVIDLFGEWWHKKDEEEIRKNFFRQYGFESIIIWGRDVYPKKVKEKLAFIQKD